MSKNEPNLDALHNQISSTHAQNSYFSLFIIKSDRKKQANLLNENSNVCEIVVFKKTAVQLHVQSTQNVCSFLQSYFYSYFLHLSYSLEKALQLIRFFYSYL